MVTPAAKRQAVAHLVANHEMSERRACRVIGCCRMTMRYEVVRQDDLLHRIPLELVAVVARPHLGFRASKLGGNACTKLGAPQTPSVASCGSVRSLVESFCRYVDARQGRELCRSGHSPTLEDDHFELDT